MTNIALISKKRVFLDYQMTLEIDCHNWENYFKNAEFSNLMQSWNYGAAKEKMDGWSIRRGIINKNDTAIALCQWLEKPILKLIKIIRINRGPIWIDKNQFNTEDKSLIYYFLSRYFSLSKGCLLFIAPALEDSEENNLLLKNLNYKKMKKKLPWKSALIDLQKTEQELRAALKSRLRNYLKHAENANHLFDISTIQSDFEDIFVHYTDQQKQKKFDGVPLNCIKLLRQFDAEKGDVFIARVKNADGQTMALKLLAIHGNHCTPLIAWTSEEGAKCHAMHLLIWKTLLYLKTRGIFYFDVGGYNEKERPSVCQFKKGFGGKEYCLVGEYRGFL